MRRLEDGGGGTGTETRRGVLERIGERGRCLSSRCGCWGETPRTGSLCGRSIGESVDTANQADITDGASGDDSQAELNGSCDVGAPQRFEKAGSAHLERSLCGGKGCGIGATGGGYRHQGHTHHCET